MSKKLIISIAVIVIMLILVSCTPNTADTTELFKEINRLEGELEIKETEIEGLENELEITKTQLEEALEVKEETIEEEKKIEETQAPESFSRGDEILFSDARTNSLVCSVVIHSIENCSDFDSPPPGEGMRYVALDVEVENLSNEVQSYSSFNYSVRDADYYRYDYSGYRKEPSLSSGDLAPMDKMRGWVLIELPQDIAVVEILAGPCFCEPPAIIKIVPPLE